MPDPALVALRDDLLAKLSGLAGLRTRAMFGTTRPAYDSAGSTGFRGSTNYRSVPDEVLADPATALRWAEDSVDATRRVKKR